MAIAFTANKVGPRIVADTTVIRMHNRGVATLDPAVAVALAPLEQQTLTAGAATFATPVDGQQYAFTWAGANGFVIVGAQTASQTAAKANSTGATPETRRTAMKAAASIVQT
jgi:hypothetical protein